MVGRLMSVGVVAAVAMVLTGCGSTPRVAEEAKPALRAMSAEMNDGEAAMRGVVDSLQALMKADMDVPAATRDFENSLARLSGVVDRVRGVRPQTNPDIGFLGRWNEDIDAMQNQAMKEAARERRDATVSAFEELDKRIERLRDEFAPFYRDLQELQTYLNNDPTPAGLRGAKGEVAELIRRKDGVMSRLGSVQSQLDKLLR